MQAFNLKGVKDHVRRQTVRQLEQNMKVDRSVTAITETLSDLNFSPSKSLERDRHNLHDSRASPIAKMTAKMIKSPTQDYLAPPGGVLDGKTNGSMVYSPSHMHQ